METSGELIQLRKLRAQASETARAGRLREALGLKSTHDTRKARLAHLEERARETLEESELAELKRKTENTLRKANADWDVREQALLAELRVKDEEQRARHAAELSELEHAVEAYLQGTKASTHVLELTHKIRSLAVLEEYEEANATVNDMKRLRKAEAVVTQDLRVEKTQLLRNRTRYRQDNERRTLINDHRFRMNELAKLRQNELRQLEARHRFYERHLHEQHRHRRLRLKVRLPSSPVLPRTHSPVLELPDVPAPARASSAVDGRYLETETSTIELGDPASTRLVPVGLPAAYLHVYNPPKPLPVIRPPPVARRPWW